jgi:hypothetical protein
VSESEPEYRIEFTIQRAEKFGEEFVDVGFGASGGSASPDDAAYAVLALVAHRQWETEPGMPDPDELTAEHEEREDRL